MKVSECRLESVDIVPDSYHKQRNRLEDSKSPFQTQPRFHHFISNHRNGSRHLAKTNPRSASKPATPKSSFPGDIFLQISLALFFLPGRNRSKGIKKKAHAQTTDTPMIPKVFITFNAINPSSISFH
ncbi:hypothetical protein CDAR_189261 [Caerostris darwini]|uniref:Uncharacterized protein n=1 Tax=Caerostris darwini TaxID=1538125 RepID=A0AAV4W2C1_9ARAC|nr:hypothetical protein CDAR_189261 [Caerostris darwini]